MKKCSQSAHQSLTELNITPLLDLAFVLLVIFIITTIPPVKDMGLTLPAAPKNQKNQQPQTIYISVQEDGKLFLDREEIPTMASLHDELFNVRSAEPETKVVVRGDAKTKYKVIRDVLDTCQQVNFVKVDLATEVQK